MMRAKSRGFSFLTLLMVVSLIAILAAILVPNFVRARARGQLTACKSHLKNLGTAMEMYSKDHHGKYPTSINQLTPNYLKTLPECPRAGFGTYRLSLGKEAPYNTMSETDYYFFECAGPNHEAVSVPVNYPQYNSIVGLIER